MLPVDSMCCSGCSNFIHGCWLSEFQLWAGIYDWATRLVSIHEIWVIHFINSARPWLFFIILMHLFRSNAWALFRNFEASLSFSSNLLQLPLAVSVVLGQVTFPILVLLLQVYSSRASFLCFKLCDITPIIYLLLWRLSVIPCVIFVVTCVVILRGLLWGCLCLIAYDSYSSWLGSSRLIKSNHVSFPLKSGGDVLLYDFTVGFAAACFWHAKHYHLLNAS